MLHRELCRPWAVKVGSVEVRVNQSESLPATEQPTAPKPTATAGAPPTQELAHAALEQTSALLADMFSNSEAGLLQLPGLAPGGAVSPLYFEAVLAARSEQGKILRAYAREISAAFRPAAIYGYGCGGGVLHLEHLSLRSDESDEESALRARINARAEALHLETRQALGQLVDRLIREQGLPLPPLALEITTLTGAFHAALLRSEISAPIRVALLQLYDRQIVPALGPWLAYAKLQLSQRDPRERRDRVRHLPVDVRSLHCLRQVAAASGRSEDAGLARELIDRLQDPDSPAWVDAAAQRIRMVGQMINGILADPLLPPAVHPLFESLRLPLIKSALADASFLSSHGHPVRALVQELATMAASSQVIGRSAVSRTQQLAREVQNQFDLSSHFVSVAMHEARLLSREDEHHFDAECRAQEQQRRVEVLQRADNLVRVQVEEALLGTDLPDAIAELIEQAWAPMMRLRLLQNGREGVPFRGAVSRLEALVESFHCTGAPTKSGVDPAATLRAMSRELNDAQLPQALLHRLMRAARKALDQRPEPATAPEIRLVSRQLGVPTAPPEPQRENPATASETPVSLAVDNAPTAPEPPAPALIKTSALLEGLCVAGRWFRVYDAEHDTTRWLRLSSYYPERGCLAFAEFDGANPLNVTADQFLTDLMLRRSEPIDPDPDMAVALSRHIDQHRN